MPSHAPFAPAFASLNAILPSYKSKLSDTISLPGQFLVATHITRRSLYPSLPTSFTLDCYLVSGLSIVFVI